jgi:cell division topological specificity factor
MTVPKWLAQLLGGNTQNSGETARQRLQLVLIQDRCDIAPETLEAMRHDIMEVLSRYLDIDETNVGVGLEREDQKVALVANVPVKSVKRGVGKTPSC